MITLLGQIFAVLAGLIGLAVLIYREYYSPKSLARKQAAKDGQQAVDDEDASRLTAAFDKLRRNK